MDCIILAAGASKRMGRPKLHLPFGHTTILGATVEAALGAGVRVIVVGRPDDALIEAYARPGRVLVAVNRNPERGMLSTLRAGIAIATDPCERGFFFILADMPLVRTSTYELLLASKRSTPLVATCGGRRGHPVFLPPALARRVLALPDSANLRALIDAAEPLFIETGDEGTVLDIDRPDEYEFAAALLAAGLSPPGRRDQPFLYSSR